MNDYTIDVDELNKMREFETPQEPTYGLIDSEMTTQICNIRDDIEVLQNNYIWLKTELSKRIDDINDLTLAHDRKIIQNSSDMKTIYKALKNIRSDTEKMQIYLSVLIITNGLTFGGLVACLINIFL